MTSPAPDHRIRRLPARAIAAVIAVLTIVLGVISPTAANADASSEPSVTIAALSPSAQKSGTAFTYRLTYACSNVNVATCAAGPTITIPLGAAAAFPVQVSASADIVSWSVAGGDLVIHLVDLVEGASGTIGITITPPNHTTPNGTTWTLVPTMTFADGTPTVTAPGVTSTATATPSLVTAKSAAQTYYRPGDTARFTVYWDCPGGTSTAAGDENLAALRIVDTLPAGLTYSSSSPAATSVSGQTLTWDIAPAKMGTGCSAGAGSIVPLAVEATVDADVPDNTVLTNAVVASGTSLSGAERSANSSARITVVRELPGAVVTKRGSGPLVNSVGDGLFDLNLNGYRSATYPGPWLGRGAATSTSSAISELSVDEPPLIEALYTLDVRMPAAGLQNSVVDPLPCADNRDGAAYSSNAPGDLCRHPAFHTTMVTVWARSVESAANVGVPSGFAPIARLTDGTEVPLTAGPVPPGAEALESGPGYRSYFVPESAIGRVAELIFPRTDGMTNVLTSYVIGGYADDARQKGDILRNVASISSYAVGDDTAYATTDSSIASVYILGGPQIGLQKYWVSDSDEFQFNAETFFPGPTTGDLTIVDTLPAGVSATGSATVDASRYSHDWVPSVPSTTTQTVDPATGRTTVTIRVAAADVNALLVDGKGDRISFAFHLPATVDPGDYTNTATINLSDPTVDDTVCTQGTSVADTAGAGFECAASAAFTVDPDPSSDAVRVSKSVKGSLDADFKTNPAIGHVGADGGSATYRLTWTNKSVQSLGNVVAYDLLPRIGDTGTVAGTLNQQRGSTFRPILTEVGTLPAGIVASYSTSTNPCRPEVLPNAQNLGCVDDWTALPASPSAALLDSVRALRFVSSSTYAFGTGFSVDLSMTTPPLAQVSDIAWNTFATAQTNLGNGQPLPPVESAKVGIARPDYSHITIDKVVDKATAHVGDTLTYTVSAINDGGRDLTDVTLRDTLPDDVTFVSATGGGTYADGVVTWNLATMPLGQRFTYTIVATATVPDGSTLVNRWGVDGGTPVTPLHPCPDPDTAEESCATTTIPAVGVVYAKTSDPVPGTAVKAGDTITYTVTATNPTTDASTSGTVTDDLSHVLDTATLTGTPTLACTPGANACGQVRYDAGDSSFTWTSSPAHPLAGGTTATITYTVRVKDDATGTVGNVLVEPGITVRHPIIVGEKSVDKGADTLVDPGDTLTYTLLVENTGAVDAASASAFDDLTNVLGNADLVAGSVHASTGTATFDAATKHLVWSGPLAAGAEATVTYSVVVKAAAHGQLRNAFLGSTVVNPISGSLQWRKIDDGAEPTLLPGAEWTLTPVDGDGEPSGDAIRIADCTSAPCAGADADPVGGRFLVPGLAPGRYRLVETAAPDGYVLDGTPIAVTVLSSTQVTTIDDVVNHPESTSTPTPTPTPSPSEPGISGLPITGLDGALTLTIGAVAVGVVMIGAVLLVSRRRRRSGS